MGATIRIARLRTDEGGLGLEGELVLEIRSGKLVLSRVRRPRKGWDTAFAAEQRKASSWDEEEWEW